MELCRGIQSHRESVEAMIAGRPQAAEKNNRLQVRQPVDLEKLGLSLVPNVVDATPPFVDVVTAGSPAANAGFFPDDLILFVGDVLVQSIVSLQRECGRVESGGTLRVLVRRGERLEKLELETVIALFVLLAIQKLMVLMELIY